MAGALILVSCSKNNDIVTPGTDEKVSADLPGVSVIIPDGSTVGITGPNVTSGTINRSGALYTVANFRQAYTSGPGQPPDGNFYWRFTVNEAGTPANFQIKFTGIATGDITSNDSIRFIDKSFASVVAADWATANNPGASPAGSNVIGMNSVVGTGVPPAVIAYANGAGWYTYLWSAGHTVIPVAGRTLLWKSGANLFKFEITSIYQNGVTGGAFPYYNFKYQQL
ncbi:hypothetical protein EG028_04710 [Chitinophaga barathri]|uniref:HmuY protein n=2 Tax=Chitinophaga barathri TaxID=1647451 RepID=A0A3N4MQU0_9BACT|nr:hypothetical protein EG028_04710 [Chitinophaga barathri]